MRIFHSVNTTTFSIRSLVCAAVSAVVALLFVMPKNAESRTWPFCPQARSLLWHHIDNEQSHSLQRLQLCCNVNRLKLIRLVPVWRLIDETQSPWLQVENLTLPGFGLVLSKCGDKLLSGNVITGNCQRIDGKIVTLSHQLVEFDQWYVTCYEMSANEDGSGSSCVTCRLNKFCTNQGRCRDTFLNIEIVNATMTSFTVLLQIGDLPFDAEINVHVYNTQNVNVIPPVETSSNEKSQKNPEENSDYYINYNSETYNKTFLYAPRNQSLAYKLTDLKMDTWYKVNVCMIVKTPPDFGIRYPGVSLPKTNTFCIKRDSSTLYNRKYNYYPMKGAQNFRCDIFCVTLHCCFSILLIWNFVRN